MKSRPAFWPLLVALSILPCLAEAQDSPDAPANQPNILVLWGDDIGTWNVSHNSRGMMGYMTPNIDRIAREGLSFTDYYGQQSCTAGRAAFIGGNVPVRTGMTKVGLPGAAQGWQATDVTMATVLKGMGYATGQFGKNHQGDLDEHLPTMHGFDEFFGNLYHLNAEEEPENEDYPGDLVLPDGETFLERYGPRGVIHSWADAEAEGDQRIEDTGPLTRERMEDVDYETSARAMEFIREKESEGMPWFVWWNGTRMHFRTHVREELDGISGQDEYSDGMVEHDMHVGQFLALLDELGIADETLVMYSTDNGPHYNSWPDAATTPFRGEKNSNWEGAFRVPAFVRFPGRFPAGVTLNGIVAHEDWLPTFAALAGDTTVTERLREGTRINGRRYRNYIDGYNQLPYLMGQTEESARQEFWYVNDDGGVVAARYDDWKIVFMEDRGVQLGVWREPWVELRAPLMFNLRRDPFEKSQESSNTYNDWLLSRSFLVVPIQGLAAQFLQTMVEYPPSQEPGSFNLSSIERNLRETIGN
jgi:arylsulfatase